MLLLLPPLILWDHFKGLVCKIFPSFPKSHRTLAQFWPCTDCHMFSWLPQAALSVMGSLGQESTVGAWVLLEDFTTHKCFLFPTFSFALWDYQRLKQVLDVCSLIKPFSCPIFLYFNIFTLVLVSNWHYFCFLQTWRRFAFFSHFHSSWKMI